MWGRLRLDGPEYYDKVRAEFNDTGDPCQFFFLLRTCQNGLVRFNKSGKFSTAFHHQRRGTPPEILRSVLTDWSEKLRRHDVQFQVGSYDQVQSREGDLLYLDPPLPNSAGRVLLRHVRLWAGSSVGYGDNGAGTCCRSTALSGMRTGEWRCPSGRLTRRSRCRSAGVRIVPRLHRSHTACM